MGPPIFPGDLNTTSPPSWEGDQTHGFGVGLWEHTSRRRKVGLNPRKWGEKKTRPGLSKLDLFMEGSGSFFVPFTKPGLKQHPAFLGGTIFWNLKEFPLPSALLCQVLEATHSDVVVLQKILFPPTFSGCGKLVTPEPGSPPPLVMCAQMGSVLHQQEPGAPSLFPEIHGAGSFPCSSCPA